jgi:hypothetical protein
MFSSGFSNYAVQEHNRRLAEQQRAAQAYNQFKQKQSGSFQVKRIFNGFVKRQRLSGLPGFLKSRFSQGFSNGR